MRGDQKFQEGCLSGKVNHSRIQEPRSISKLEAEWGGGEGARRKNEVVQGSKNEERRKEDKQVQ